MPEWVSYLLVFVAGLVVGRALGRGSRETPRAPSLPPPPPPPELEAKVRALLLERKKIEAIKLYRESMGVGLKEAKEAVEAIDARTR